METAWFVTHPEVALDPAFDEPVGAVDDDAWWDDDHSPARLRGYLTRGRYAAAVLPEPVDDDELVSPHTVTENHPHRHAFGCGHPAVQPR